MTRCQRVGRGFDPRHPLQDSCTGMRVTSLTLDVNMPERAVSLSDFYSVLFAGMVFNG